jgi:hypothetical protein
MATTIDVASARERSAQVIQDDIDIEACQNEFRPSTADTAPSDTSTHSPSPSANPAEVVESITPRERSGIGSSLRRRRSSPSPHYPGCLMQHVGGECPSPRQESDVNPRWLRDANGNVRPMLTPSSNSPASRDEGEGVRQRGREAGGGLRPRRGAVDGRQASGFSLPQVGGDLKWQASKRRDFALKYVS